MAEEIKLNLIRRDGGTQSRAFINDQTVREYREALSDGAKLPEATVFFDGNEYWLADGFHRCKAAIDEGWKEYPCEVIQGSQRDAILYSVGANASHGLPRSNSDKQRAVSVLLNDDEWKQWSDREIARKANVSTPFVSKLRKPHDVNNYITERKFNHQSGKVSTRKVKPKASKPEPMPEPVRPEVEEWEEDNEPIEEPEFEREQDLESVLYEVRYFDGWDNKPKRDEIIARFNKAYDKEFYGNQNRKK